MLFMISLEGAAKISYKRKYCSFESLSSAMVAIKQQANYPSFAFPTSPIFPAHCFGLPDGNYILIIVLYNFTSFPLLNAFLLSTLKFFFFSGVL